MAREGPFWDVMKGRREPPPAATLLGWKLVAVDPDAGTIEVSFEATTDLHVQFLSPAKPGRLVGRGCTMRRGRDVAFLAGELVDDQERVVATATATAVIRQVEI